MVRVWFGPHVVGILFGTHVVVVYYSGHALFKPHANVLWLTRDRNHPRMGIRRAELFDSRHTFFEAQISLDGSHVSAIRSHMIYGLLSSRVLFCGGARCSLF